MMIRILYSIVVFFLFASTSSYAQVVINEQQEVTMIMDAYKRIANSASEIDGWRIQIINTDDRRQMESARSKFAAKYNHVDMTWSHVQPYYQVQVGAYRSKLELEAFLRQLKEDFPRAIPVRDKINKSELKY